MVVAVVVALGEVAVMERLLPVVMAVQERRLLFPDHLLPMLAAGEAAQ